MFPEPGILGSNFYDIFKVLPNQQRKSDWKKLKKPGSFKMRDKRKMKMDVSNNIGVESETPEVSLPGNASSFAVFATLRLAVLERWMRQACEIYASSSACSPHLAPQQLSDDETEDTSTEKTKETTPKIPKIVGVGLRSVFELIRESRASHPALCTKALLALLDVLQGQQPEGLKNEPIQVIEPLFDLLLDLTMHPLPDLETSSEGNAANQLTAVACACLLSLVTVRGDTGKLLRAVSSLLMCPKPVASQNIILPNVLLELDRSVYTVLLGKLVCPDWITHGVPKSSCISTFTFKAPETIATPLSVNSMASDGQFLYVHCSQGLFKIGSGYSGTIKGHVYAYKDKFHENEKSWLGFISNSLYFRGENSSMEWEVIDRNSLAVTQVISMSSSYSPCDISSGVMFTDCNQFAVISVAKDDGFVVRYMNPNSPSTLSTDLPLKLARKTVEVFGSATFDEETNIHPLHTGFDDEIAAVVSGKEFSLARTTNGKVFYSGKGSVLGIKQSWPRTGRWSELIIPKASKIIQIAVGHEGSHAILVTEDGSTYFTGTARRGEDGDQSKVRRQAKTVKPKKMAKMDGHFVVNAACNNGTTALVTREGELFMFGKDTSSCDPATGLVSELKDTQITQIALGKAHAVALTSKGHIYTFGINNKGQCGREFTPLVKDSTPHVVAMETAVEEDAEDGDDSSQDMMCEPGTHKWKHDLCMVCTICRECTGYSISCLSSMRPDRNPGQECGCGEGDSGCEECGCCRICARENVDNSELAILGPSGAGDVAGMMRLDLIFGGRHGSRLQDHLQRRLDERKQRQRGRIGMVRHAANTRARLNQRAAAGSAQSSITKHIVSKSQISSSSNNLIVEDGVSGGGGSDIEKDATRVTSLPPARVTLPSASPVVQIACGLHHTVVLTQDGEVFTFGSNNYGQLGMGDVQVRGGPVCVKFPTQAIHVAAGSNHTVVVSAKGELYSFGSHQKNQLGRGAPSKESSRNHWYSVPGLVPQTGARYGRRATWVGASADQTYVRIDESLINSISLKHSALVANKSCIMLLPTQCSQSKQFKCLVISKRDGNCIWFSGDNQVDFSRCTVCLDPLYNVLWSYQLNASNNQISCYNVIASEAPIQNNHSPSLLNCELTLPCVPGTSVSSAQIALHLLASLDTLTGSQHLQHQPQLSDDKMLPVSKHYSREDYCYVNRFEGHGGGWGYSGHSTEAIRFMVDSDILLGGFGLFGGRGEYTGKIKLFDIGMEGGDQEGDGELLAETEEIAYECGPRQKFPLFFEESVPLQANRWYVAWARVSGPSSDCGSGGQAIVSADDQVVFYFKTSKKSNNGTDVNAGQIPQLLYHLVTPESQAPTRHVDSAKEVYILSREFSRTASKECFESLLSLLEWSWASYKTSLVDAIQHNIGSVNHILATLELKYLVYICCACLRLLRIYTTEIYPNQVSQKKRVLESVLLAESVGDVRALLRQILTDNLPSSYRSCKSSKNHSASSIFIKLTKEILDECHETFVSCYHVFYPTVYLKWTSLCDLLSSTEKVSVMKYDRLLSAVFAALCNPTVRLRSTFPIFSTVMECNESSLKRQLSPADNSGLPMMPCLDTHHYPILVEQMSYRSQLEGVKAQNTWTFKDVLDRLLDLIYIPVMQALSQEKVSHSKQLAHYCCQLIARVVAELTAQTTGVDEDVDGGCGRVLYTTPSRFSRTNPTRTWNTGNGSPDAICFSVDRVGIVIAGVGVYGGAGNYDYELEILDNQSTVGQETQRWNSLQMTRGTFSSDDVNNEDIADIKFDFPIFIKENVKYAIRLRNHGGRTSNGDGGLSSVRGPDNTLFTFSTCSLSFNGTTQTRGQIPYILYYSDPTEQECAGGSKSLLEAQARKITLNIASAVVSRTVELFTLAREKEDFQTLSGVDLVTTLLPLMLAHIGPLASSEPRCGVQVLNLIQDLLPHVCALNLMAGSARLSASEDTTTDITTTSHHYAWVESDHPYKPATVSNYRVLFPESVQWMCLEFDSRSGTAQSEDSLQLYIPASAASVQQALDSEVEEIPPYWPVLHRLSSQPSHWPQSAIVLPGNEVIFSLETASDYIKDDKACTFGFRCLVIGYEWRSNSNDGLKQLETELSFLGGMCTASLMKKDLSLPFTINGEDVDSVDEETEMVCNQHMSLLGKGFALANPPTVSQALDGILPFSCPSNERLFLRDFVLAAAGTSGGRLAHWLQPDPYVDVSRCELVPLRNGPPSGPHPATAPTLRCDCPATFTLHIRDQYGNPVQVPNLKVEMKAIPIEKKVSERKAQRLSQCDQMTFGGHPQPPLDVPYQVTIKDRMNFYSISIMKAYENYSFEELRFMAPPVQRTCETMMVRAHGDGSVTGTWTPANIGCYSIQVTIDDCPFPETMKVEVKEPPQGVNSAQQIVARKVSHQPNKIREFVGKNSAGLRIRAHPSLQSEQIGIVPCGATVAFVDEVRNSDGIWVRLCQDTIRQYCQGIVDEAWCLQLNQHFGKTLLVPLSTNPPVPQKPVQPELSDRNMPAVYKVVMSGASGHNVRDSPSLKGTPVGMLVLGDSVTVIDHVINNEGKWVRLSEETIMKKCLNQTAEAWSLALDKTQVAYLRPGNHESPRKLSTKTFLSAEKEFSSSPKKSQFDFGNKGGKTVDVVDPKDASSKLTSTHHNLFIFGSSAQTEVPRKSSSKMVAEKECSTPSKKGSSFQNKVSALVNENVPSPINRILHRNTSLDSAVASGNMKSAKNKDVTPRTWSSSKGSKIDDVKVKAEKHYHIKHDFGEELQNVSVKDLVSRANGNRTVIPAQTTTPRKVPHSSNAPPSPGSSPSLPASSWTPSKGTRESVDSASSSPLHSSGISPLVSMIESGGGLSNTSAMISSITPDPSSAEAVSDKFPDEVMKIEILEFNSNNYNKSLMQTGTQTSPDKNFQNCFNFGTVPEKEEPPRRTRKERIHSHKRSASPPQRQAVPPTPVNAPTHSSKTKESSASVKEALSPSVAESIRAVFAALLWHEGIVHDAMACASFLKFYPTLSKQGVTVTPRHIKREKIASHRHSVEVSMAESFLHIAPSTLETLTLTRQAATVSANRQHRAKHKQQQSIIKEEVTGDKRPSTQSQLQMLGERIEKGKQDEGKVPQPSMLPPALKCLVLLWEQLTSNCLQIFESSAVSSQTFSSMNKLLSEETEVRRSVRKKKELKANTANAENSKNVGNKCSEKEAVCELCGNFYPHPVTYHMRQAHPGCGGHAGGNGYNSGGNYCVGWAGNCGDGGLAGSSWYIICNSCREKYLEIMKRATAKKSTRKKSAKLISPSPTASATSLFHGSETHLTMRDNAMFLLELSGGSKNTMNLNQSPPDFINSEFPPPGPFQCLQSLGANPEVLRDDSPPLELMPKRRDSDIFSSSRPLSVCESESRGLFHRSISMGMNGVPWPDSKILNSKKRNSAICDPNSDSSSSLLGHPSAALRKLVPSVLGDLSSVEIKGSSQGIKSTFDIMSHPVLAFICQKHNLVSLRLAMKQSLRKATCRVYAMQALNWLLHSATQAICLHDLLWWFVAALTPIQTSLLTTTSVNKEESSEFCKLDRKDSEEMGWVCEHPLSDMGLVGEAVYHLPSTFHILLQTIADLMLLLPMGSALQQMAVRCWGIRFTQTDHMFLHRSKVFSNISKILARSEEIEDPSHSFHESHVSTYSQTGTYVEILGDLTSFVDIKASSRQAMIGSLTDNSTETFWESGDEDRSKTKSLMFVSPANLSPRMIYVHIDNCRDIANKVSSIVFLAGANGDELFRLRSIDVEVRASGWINCPILNNNHSVVKLELKGPDSSLRVRQVRILGEIEGESLRLPQQHSAMTIQQRNTEAETLRVFRLITAQVFGKLLEGKKEINSCDEGSEETNDLKEHMVGILFSRSKLTHLQKQVCMHIVQAIRRESVGIREDWEHRLCSGSGTSTTELSDSYCFEMLSMVLALSGSSVGRSYLAHQHAFLLDLTGLLHTGSARIQRQVILLLRRMLPEVSPSTLADILRVESLPPTDISVALATYRSQEMEFNPHRAGLLDVLFSCIAKALTVQIKVKGSKDSKGISSVSLATSIHPRDEVGCRWWLRGSILRKLAEDIINLIKDMCLGRLSEIWVKVTKAAIAECILNLTRLTESDRESVNCLRSPTLWLALAALCVLHPDHVDSLSSAQWDTTPDGKPPPPRPTCTNHDDGETSAIIQCNACGNLCADCDRFLHLHRRTRMHQRQVCKEEEEAIKVDLHEGCGRIKLFWILALADSCTLKAMVEFRERTRLQSKLPGLTLGVCRFCGTTGNSGLLAIGNICADQDCQEHAKNACSKVHPCGHMCAGIVGEIDCLPCLHGCGQDNSLKQDADDMCMICFTEALSCAPSIQLRCGHIFHLHCCRSQLLKKWAGPRITFSFQQCPICKAPIEHPVLNDLLIPIRNLLEDVGRKALMRLEYEGLDRGRPDPASYAIERYAYYVCFKCNKAYYGGEARCDAELGRGDFDPSELVCGGCSDVSRAQMCPKHGTDFLEYKCRYCCSVAVFFCFGTTHFCNACHDDFQRVTNIPPSELPTCPAGPKARQLDGEDCPLHIRHPPTGVEFALGCGVCRNAHTF